MTEDSPLGSVWLWCLIGSLELITVIVGVVVMWK